MAFVSLVGSIRKLRSQEWPIYNKQISDFMNDEVQIQFMGLFVVSEKHSYYYVLQIQDILSRYSVMIPTETCTTETEASTMVNHWICSAGVPRTALSERGSHFISEVFRAMCRLLSVQQRIWSSHHPTCHSHAERQNQLLDIIKC